MLTKNVVFMIVTVLAIVGVVFFLVNSTKKKKKEKFVGDLAMDSGFYKVDTAMGGSGLLTDPINQS
ncbi:hypothetical protein PBCVNEJV1_780L [Paramecium bursaria Chlorella virus NE-JV-1]|nr:hypothetical protein PBCVNEJV1_780L [Paramecium bursaria Chlorella virus NE-JV-1]